MTLIQLVLTGTCLAAGLGAVMVGNFLEALLLWMMPVGYFAFIRIRAAREQRNAEMKKQQEESDRFWAKERELRRAEHTKSSAEIYERHRAAQMQQMNMMHQNASQASAAQQQAAMHARQGWTDPRASYGSDLADNIINLWAINSMMNQSSGVHASTISPSGPAVTDTPPSRVDPIQFHSFVNSGSESSSSSSSYSSDTSSDSFGGSDTSSDSF
jgi:hypothetical protein